jgi:hypothetical protein
MLSSRTPSIRAGAARLVGLVAQHTFAVRLSRDADPFRPFDLLVTGTYSVYLLYWYNSARSDPFRPFDLLVTGTYPVYLLYWYNRYSVYLRYWYARRQPVPALPPACHCYSVYLLYWYISTSSDAEVLLVTCTHFYLLYWYTRTNTDTYGLLVIGRGLRERRTALKVLALLALLVQKYKY